MNMATKKFSRPMFVGPAGKLIIHRDVRTGQVVVNEIISPTGNVVVKGGPITGGTTHPVLMPQGRTKLQSKQLHELIDLMSLKLPA